MKALSLKAELLLGFRVLGVSLISCLLVGCDSKVMVPIKGSVTSQGKPLPGATVMMFLDGDDRGQTASGVADEDGVFSISTGVDVGIPPGTYTVTITWPDPGVQPTAAQMMAGNRPDQPDLLQGTYATRATSTLKTEVTTSTLVLEPFEVVVPEKKPAVAAAPEVDDNANELTVPKSAVEFEARPE